MKIYAVVWSDGGPKQLDPRPYHKIKTYSSLASAKGAITTRLNNYWTKKNSPQISGAILESEINWTPWDGK